MKVILCHERLCEAVARYRHDIFDIPVCNKHRHNHDPAEYIIPSSNTSPRSTIQYAGRRARQSVGYGRQQDRWADWRMSGEGLNGPVIIKKAGA